ncbi:MAG: hypothetical protein ACOY5W_06640 [Pseudomonadota bacterium]
MPFHSANAWAKLDAKLQETILDALPRVEEDKVLSRTTFKKWLKVHMNGEALPVPALKLLQKRLGEHDDATEIRKSAGKVEPNPDLRDNENVPLGEDIHAYFEREVLPHVSNAWIDETKSDHLPPPPGRAIIEFAATNRYDQYTKTHSQYPCSAEASQSRPLPVSWGRKWGHFAI